MEEQVQLLLRSAHELNRRILQNPQRRLQIVQEFYSEIVITSDPDTAHLILLIKSMVEATSESAPGSNPFILLNQGNIQGNINMEQRDTKIGQAAVVGDNAHVHDVNFNQIWNEVSSQADTKQLAGELIQLRDELLKRASGPDHYIAIGEVAAAEKAASANDGPTALRHLKTAGKWAFDAATQIGTTLAAEVLKKTLSIG